MSRTLLAGALGTIGIILGQRIGRGVSYGKNPDIAGVSARDGTVRQARYISAFGGLYFTGWPDLTPFDEFPALAVLRPSYMCPRIGWFVRHWVFLQKASGL
jgi:hypothetical protein